MIDEECKALAALRDRYRDFVITHVTDAPWIALPLWTLRRQLEAATAGELAERMDEMLASRRPPYGSHC